VDIKDEQPSNTFYASNGRQPLPWISKTSLGDGKFQKWTLAYMANKEEEEEPMSAVAPMGIRAVRRDCAAPPQL